MLIKIIVGLVVVIAAVLIVAALQPAAFRVERKATIGAPAAVAFPLVNDLHKFQDWSPWAKLDPNCKTTFEGPAAGTGAIFRWEGSSKVGAGSMEVTDSRPSEVVRMRLDFLKPFKGTNRVEFSFTPQGDNTVVTWSMIGQKNFICKAMGLFLSMDKMCGDQFEQGLASMKEIAEAEAKKEPALVPATAS